MDEKQTKEKVTVERGTPQETLMLPLFGGYKANRMYPGSFKDTTAKRITDLIDYDMEQANMGKGPQSVCGMRWDVTERMVDRSWSNIPTRS